MNDDNEIPCARENRVVPIMGSIYCGCPKCDPPDDDEEYVCPLFASADEHDTHRRMEAGMS